VSVVRVGSSCLAEEPFVIPKVGASYVGKKIYDYVMTPPPPRPAPEADATEVPAEEWVDDLDGKPFHDEEGQPLGTAFRLREVGVYVVGSGYGRPAVNLERALLDPETRLFWRTVDGRVVALIYVPDPSRTPAAPEALRADDI
jgi:hypothetical protein